MLKGSGKTHIVTKVLLDIQLPPGFPDKYKEAVIRSADQCAVKKHMAHPPAFEIKTAYDLLAIAAHPGDADLQMGGTLAKITRAVRRALNVALCDGEPAAPPRVSCFSNRGTVVRCPC